MQRWALIFDLDVVLVNATGHLAAMNVAGPNSREVLEKLTDVDMSPAAFPYLGVREGTVCGAPAIIMRVGFVGELGYEVHVPASQGLHVWTSLMESGRRLGIRPFGVEAQRLLRLEKGHLIVGQDTDALTNPFEADVAWAIGKNKPFFIGARTLDVLRKKPLMRRLVGIAFPPEYRGRLPEECHLILSAGEIVGRITSMAHRSTLGHPLAMAFIRPDMADAGTKVSIRVDKGDLVEAEVSKLPFYDPENARQQ
jgi:sarcosine oxidase subunit alpha